MAKNENIAHENPAQALFGDLTHKIVSRSDGPEFDVHVNDVHADKWPVLFKGAVADLITSKSQVGIEKPKREDFLNEDEHKAALEEWAAEKVARKHAFVKALKEAGEKFPETPAWSRISPVRTEMNVIATEDLRKYFAGAVVRQSTPKGVFAFPEGKDLASFVTKWLDKYGTEIQTEAEENLKSGKKSVQTASAEAVEF